jgi:response regulator RpfG family c-di-GMP phosphodiesterase
MSQIIILCIEDEREVLDALVRDLQPFTGAFRIEAAETVEEARPLVRQWIDRGDSVGLVLADHLLPGTNGVEFLIELNHDPATQPTRKVLVTAQAALEDTIKAVNDADLDHYIAKPWSAAELHEVVRRLLTDYVLENVENVLPYMKILDAPRLMEKIRTSQPE